MYQSVIDPITLAVVQAFLNIPYRFGGNSPLSGLDCSQLVVEILKTHGAVANNYDGTAQDLYNRFTDIRYGVEVKQPKFFCLCFYGKDRKNISHVTFALDHYRAVGANGGTSETLTLEEAVKRDARVEVRPISYRKDLLAIVQPHPPGLP